MELIKAWVQKSEWIGILALYLSSLIWNKLSSLSLSQDLLSFKKVNTFKAPNYILGMICALSDMCSIRYTDKSK